MGHWNETTPADSDLNNQGIKTIEFNQVLYDNILMINLFIFFTLFSFSVFAQGEILSSASSSEKIFGIDYRFTQGTIEASQHSREIDISAHSVMASYFKKLKNKLSILVLGGVKRTEASVNDVRFSSKNYSDLGPIGRGTLNYQQNGEFTWGGFYDLDRYIAMENGTSSETVFSFVIKHALGASVSYKLPKRFWTGFDLAAILPSANNASAIKYGQQIALKLGYTWKKIDLTFIYERLSVKTEDYNDKVNLMSLNVGYAF